MKKLILLLLFIPLNSFSQDYKVNRIETEYSNKMGLKLIGKGVYRIGVKGGDLGGKKQQVRRAEKTIKQFAESQNKKYKIISTEVTKYTGVLDSPVPFALVTFELRNLDGSLFISKDDAKNQLIELKEYLDLGIITQEEFDKKVVSLKKILLGN